MQTTEKTRNYKHKNRQSVATKIRSTLNAERFLESVITLVAMNYDLPLSAFTSKSRKRNLVVAKQMVCTIVKEVNPIIPLNQIANALNQHHSTIIHSIKTLRTLMDSDVNVAQTYQLLRDTAMNECLNPVDGQNERYYMVNLNDCYSIRISDRKSVVLSGFTQEEAEMIGAVCSENDNLLKPVKHTNTGIFIFEEKEGGGVSNPID